MKVTGKISIDNNIIQKNIKKQYKKINQECTRLFRHMLSFFLLFYPIRLYFNIRAANNIATIFMTFINGLMAGPAVSFVGSPTVSPTTAAACVGFLLPSGNLFPPRFPDSMYFLALSHAAPPVVIISAR